MSRPVHSRGSTSYRIAALGRVRPRRTVAERLRLARHHGPPQPRHLRRCQSCDGRFIGRRTATVCPECGEGGAT